MTALLLFGLPVVALVVIGVWPTREQLDRRRRRRAYRRARTITIPRQRTTERDPK
ncbi:hypothetical protein [Kitasatospora sp. NPDC056181]|uniref:hypothetical protein n=1 Tax=Kitasatospora sp. NPDC056181 TaxID=3345737 RepID=UPI0035E2E302